MYLDIMRSRCVMDHKEKAAELFNSGCNCAQAVFCAFSDVTGIDIETGMKLSSSFGGGMGKLREVCGACTGAFAVAGALWGYTDVKDHKAKSAHYVTIRRIAEEFKEKHQTYLCSELMDGIANAKGKDPAERTPEYYAVRPCCRFVMDAAEILDKIIADKAVENE